MARRDQGCARSSVWWASVLTDFLTHYQGLFAASLVKTSNLLPSILSAFINVLRCRRVCCSVGSRDREYLGQFPHCLSMFCPPDESAPAIAQPHRRLFNVSLLFSTLLYLSLLFSTFGPMPPALSRGTGPCPPKSSCE